MAKEYSFLKSFRKGQQSYLLLIIQEHTCLQIGGEMKSFSDILSILGIVLLNLFMMPIPEAQQTVTHTGLPENRDIKLIMT